MKKLLFIIASIAALSVGFASCNDDDDGPIPKDYIDWYNSNEEWIKEQTSRTNPDGTPYFEVVKPSWNPGISVLVHYFNDRAETSGNLAPISSSTIRVYYRGYYYNGTPFDSSTVSNTDLTFSHTDFQLNGTIPGWVAAFTTMHCGDTAEIIIPYTAAYGTNGNGRIPPYSALRFNVRLIDIPYYEAPPYD